MKKGVLILVIVFQAHICLTQNVNPGPDEVFKEDEVARIYITMDDVDRDFLLDDANIWSSTYLPARFRFVNSLMDTTLSFNVGIRLRGNTSRGAPKRSLKLKFKEFEGEKFFDHKKFNLKAEVNDPSLARELLTMQTFRKAGVPAARTHHSEVYLNGQYMGLYLNVEQIDNEFAQSRFDNDKGNIYKCSYGATLEDDNSILDNSIYELKTNTDVNDRSVLFNFIDVLNNTLSESFEQKIEEVFNVNSFLTYLAVETLTGHWDGYSYLKNNYYLYESSTGKIEFIAYDTDNTFGIDWVGQDWAARDVLNWAETDDPRPLNSRILGRKKYMDQYKLKLRALLDSDFSEAYFFPEMDRIKNMIAESVSTDTFYPRTFGYSFDDFEDSYSKVVVDHAEYGLKPYITTRVLFADEQVGQVVTSLDEEIYNAVSIYPNPVVDNKLMLKTQLPFQSIGIVDAMGRNVSFDLDIYDQSEYTLSFDLPNGFYMLNVDGIASKFVVR